MTKTWTILSIAAATMLFALAATAQIDYNTTGWGVDPMEYSRVGSSGWQFLKLPTGARNTAMGGVRSALGYGRAGDALTNPASTADVRGTDFDASHMQWVADINYSTLSLVKNAGEWGSFGVNLVYLDYGEMVRTEIGEFNGTPGMVAETQGLGTFSAHDLAVGISYARRITDHLQLGGTARFLEEQLDDAVMHAWTFDIGTLYWTGLGSLRISMLGKSFGPDAEYASFADRIEVTPVRIRMPMVFVMGAAYDPIDVRGENPSRLTVAGEYVKPNDGPEKFNLGVEYFAFRYFYARGGYRFNYDEESLTAGLGAEYGMEDGLTFRIDYAYADVGRFGSVNMISIGIGL